MIIYKVKNKKREKPKNETFNKSRKYTKSN